MERGPALIQTGPNWWLDLARGLSPPIRSTELASGSLEDVNRGSLGTCKHGHAGRSHCGRRAAMMGATHARGRCGERKVFAKGGGGNACVVNPFGVGSPGTTLAVQRVRGIGFRPATPDVNLILYKS